MSFTLSRIVSDGSSIITQSGSKVTASLSPVPHERLKRKRRAKFCQAITDGPDYYTRVPEEAKAWEVLST